MSFSREFEGKNVEDAVQTASEQLNILSKDLKYEVLSYGSTGIFGLVGAKKARIRVDLPEKVHDKEHDKKTKKEIKEEPKKKPHKYDKKEHEITPFDKNIVEDKMDEFSTIGKEILEKIIALLAPDSEITDAIENGRIFYQIKGQNCSLLIGKRGQTLDAVQYIIEKAINKKSSQRIRVTIDVEGYLEGREMSLQEMAAKVAAKVKKTGKPATVGHMTAHDRRIVHLALKNDNKIRTQSMGEGFLKKLVIFPKINKKNLKSKNEP